MLAIAAMGLMLLQTFRTMLRSSSAPPAARKGEAAGASSQAETGSRTSPALDPLSLQQGAWSLGSSSWTVSLVDLSDTAGHPRLRSLGSRAAGEATPSELEEQLLRWLRQYRPVVVDGCRVYNVPLRGVQARLVTGQQGGRERLRLAQLVWSKGRIVQLLELSPAPHAAANKTEANHLLPLPAGVASLARRWDDSDRLSCELLGPASVQQCLQAWSAVGWTSEKVATDEPFSLVLLRHGERRVQLWSVETGQPGSSAYLLLTTLSAKP